jgi:thioredoxin 1
MQSTYLIKLSVLVLVVAAVVAVLLVKKADTDATSDAQPVSSGSAVAVEGPGRDAPDPPAAAAKLPKLIDLGADKCIPCKKMAPILEALREDFAGQLEVVFIDVWKNRQAAGAYGIKLIPTQIFFDADGNELFRHEGFFSREDILGKWSELGYALSIPTGDDDAG